MFEDAPLLGRGADGFALARLPYRKDFHGAGHAHGFLPQTMSDLGLLGLLVVLALLIAWLVAAGRTLGVRRRGSPGPDWSPERVVLAALGLCVLAYGIQSAIDWTWFIPGPTVAALAAAGFLAGRGPLAPVGATAAAEAEPRLGLARLREAPALALIGSTALVITALLCAWAVWQPQRSAAATDKAVALVEEGKFAQAVDQADKARRIDPYSADPLYARASALARAGHPVAGYRALEQAVAEHPRDPDTWLQMAQYEQRELNLPQRAVESAHAALTIDPQSPRAQQISAAAAQAVAASAPPPAKPPAP